MSRSTTRSWLITANLEEFDTRSASHSSRYNGSTMISPNGTRSLQDGRSFSWVSSLRPDDSVSNVHSHNPPYTRSAASRHPGDRQSATSYRSDPRVSDRRLIRASLFDAHLSDRLYDEPYARSPYSTASRHGGSQNSRSTARNLPYDVEERTPGDYRYFQDLGYTGASGEAYKHPTTRSEYEAMYGRPKSKRSGASSSRISEYEDYGSGATAVSSRYGAGVTFACSTISKNSSRSRALARIPSAHKR